MWISRNWKRYLLLLLVITSLFGGIACQNARPSSADKSAQSGSVHYESHAKSEEAAGDDYPSAAAAPSTPAAHYMGAKGAAGAADRAPDKEPQAPTGPAHQTTPQTARKVVYESWMRVAVHNIAEEIGKVRKYTESVGGFVQLSSGARLVLRIPAAHHDAAIAYLKALGDVRSLHMTSQDVTDQYTDLVARIDNLRAIKARYEALLAQAQTTEDRLAIARELRRITQELGVLEEQLVVLKDRVALCTITLDLERKQPKHVARVTPAQPFAFVRDHGAQSLLR